MKIFVSWSGEPSKSIAKVLDKRLREILPGAGTFMSFEHIEMGVRWAERIKRQLSRRNHGIVCLTPQNLNAPWIIYEAGALTKNAASRLWCILFAGLSKADVPKPLGDFQLAQFNKTDMRRVVHSINNAIGARKLTRPDLDKNFEQQWRGLANTVKSAQMRASKKLLFEERYPIPPRQDLFKVVGAPNLGTSPLQYDNLVADCEKHLVMAGQCLYFLTRKDDEPRRRSQVFDFLHQGKELDILICDFMSRAAVNTWCSIQAERYRKDLHRSTFVFRSWQRQANKDPQLAGRLIIRRTTFVPLSISFVDPKESRGYLVFVPNAFQTHAPRRPCFAYSKQGNPDAFAEYWSAYDHCFHDTRHTCDILQ